LGEKNLIQKKKKGRGKIETGPFVLPKKRIGGKLAGVEKGARGKPGCISKKQRGGEGQGPDTHEASLRLGYEKMRESAKLGGTPYNLGPQAGGIVKGKKKCTTARTPIWVG